MMGNKAFMLKESAICPASFLSMKHLPIHVSFLNVRNKFESMAGWVFLGLEL